MTEGKVGCMQELGITESFSVKRQVLVQASEAAEMILRFAQILTFNLVLKIFYGTRLIPFFLPGLMTF